MEGIHALIMCISSLTLVFVAQHQAQHTHTSRHGGGSIHIPFILIHQLSPFYAPNICNPKKYLINNISYTQKLPCSLFFCSSFYLDDTGQPPRPSSDLIHPRITCPFWPAIIPPTKTPNVPYGTSSGAASLRRSLLRGYPYTRTCRFSKRLTGWS